MATLPGRCVNEMFCSFAASGQIVRVPADARFVCPQCGRALVSPNAPFRSQVRRGSAGGVVSIVSTVVGFIVGMVLGGMFVWPAAPVIVPVNTVRLPPPPPVVAVPVLTPPPPASLTVTRPERRYRTPPAGSFPAAAPR